MSPTNPLHQTPEQGWIGPVLALGFGCAVVMWCAAFVTHFPGIDLPGNVAGPAVIAAWLAAAIVAGRFIEGGVGRGAVIGAGAGVVTALLGVLILGSMLVERPAGELPAPGAEGLRPGAVVTVLGFLGLGAAIGGIGGAIGAGLRSRERHEPGDWLARFATVAAASIVPLLLVGGAVTSTDSGMAIVGWPDSYGANMFLYPISLMAHPQRFLEHTHRLFGSLTGLTTLTLMVWVLLRERRGWVKTIAIVLFALVCVQGVIGGMRVRIDSRHLALVHGIAAQVVFGLAVSLAAVLSPTFKAMFGGAAKRAVCERCGYDRSGLGVSARCPECGTTPAPPVEAVTLPPQYRRLRFFTTGALHATLLQLVLGATYRHLKMIGSPGASHAVWAHVGFSVVVVVMVLAAAFTAQAAANRAGPAGPTLHRVGAAMVAVVILQFVLGWVTLWAVNAHPSDQFRWVPPLTATIHQANGALVLALTTLGFVWTRGLGRAVGVPQPG